MLIHVAIIIISVILISLMTTNIYFNKMDKEIVEAFCEATNKVKSELEEE